MNSSMARFAAVVARACGALCVAQIVWLLGCSNPEPATPQVTTASEVSELPKVATSKPIRKPIVQKSEQPGRLEAFTSTPIYAKVSGFLGQLLVDIGDRVTGPKIDGQGRIVEAGQLLVVLQAPELDEELHQKSAMVAQAAAEVEQARAAVLVAESIAVSSQASLDESIAGEHRAEALYQRAKSEAERTEKLVASRTINQKLADDARQELKAADAARDEAAAKRRLSTAKKNEAAITITKVQADVRASEARLQVAQADRDRVKAMCDYLEIRAPFSGIITQRNVDIGLLVQAARGAGDSPLFVLVRPDVLRLSVDIPEAEAGLVAFGSLATVTVPALAARTFQGKVSRTGWALQPGTRALKCEIDVPNPEGVLRPGMYAQVDLTIAQKSDAMTLPRGAVAQQDGQSFCLIVGDDGVLIRKLVQIGIRSALEVEILDGLDGTESVVASNITAFKAGQAVARVEK